MRSKMLNNTISKIINSKTCAFIFLSVLPVSISIFVFYVLNLITPVWWDDFIMACVFTEWHAPHTTLLSSFSDIISSTYNMYDKWHGRIVANFLNFIFMYFKDKTIFNICNTIVYCIFILLIGYHAVGSFKKVSGYLFLFINVFLWLFLSAWGQTLLWLTGSFNYLWTSTIILIFLIPFRKKADNKLYKPHVIVSLLWIIIGSLAGCSMENSASGVLILLLAYFIYVKYKKEKIALFEITGSIGFLIGFIILINARNNIFPGFLVLFKNVFIVGFKFIMNEAFILGAIIILVINLIIIKKTYIQKVSYSYFIAALGSVAAMVMVGEYGGRSAFMTQILLIITLISLMDQYRRYILEKKYIIMASILILLGFFPSFYSGCREIVYGFLVNKAREYYIINEKNNGNLDLYVKSPIIVKDSHSAMYSSEGFDVLDDPSDKQYIAHNSAKVTSYGINSFNSIPPSRKKNALASVKEFNKLRKKEGLGINDMYRIIYENW